MNRLLRSLSLPLLVSGWLACTDAGGSRGGDTTDTTLDVTADGAGDAASDASGDGPADTSADSALDASADAEPDTVADVADAVGTTVEERFGFYAYGSSSASDGLMYLWDMKIDGTDMRSLPMTGVTGIADASWSGDGRRVAFTAYEEGFTNSLDDHLPVMVMNTDGTGLEQVGTGRFPSFSVDGTFLAWVSHTVETTTDDPPRYVRKFDLHTAFFDGREPVRLSGTPGGAVSTGPSTSEGITQIVARSTPAPAVFALYQSSTPDDEGFSINETAIMKFREGGVDVISKVDGDIVGITFMGVDYLGDAWWAEWKSEGEGRVARIQSTSGVSSSGHTEAAGMSFSPNALRTLQSSGGLLWFGSPTYEDQVRVTFGLPTLGVRSWFEVP
jgi:hypothetical protein